LIATPDETARASATIVLDVVKPATQSDWSATLRFRMVRVKIGNKNLDIQSFQDKGDFVIAEREADYKTDLPWAAFTIYKMR
jgi:hypothetical protein